MKNLETFRKILINSRYNEMAFALLRIAISILMLLHGYDKLIHFSEKAPEFFSIFGLSSELSLVLAILSEFICSILVCLGLITRIALIPLMFTMAVAFFIVHSNDAFNIKEIALLYLLVFLVIFIYGPGKYSLDNFFFRKD